MTQPGLTTDGSFCDHQHHKMAKGTRSNHKKHLNTWKRNHLVPGWQAENDARRAAALEAAQNGASVKGNVVPEPPSDEVEMEEERGRQKPAKEKRRRDILPVPLPKSEDDMQTDTPKKGKGRKGAPSGGVQKKRRAGKLFLIGGYVSKDMSPMQPHGGCWCRCYSLSAEPSLYCTWLQHAADTRRAHNLPSVWHAQPLGYTT